MDGSRSLTSISLLGSVPETAKKLSEDLVEFSMLNTISACFRCVLL